MSMISIQRYSSVLKYMLYCQVVVHTLVMLYRLYGQVVVHTLVMLHMLYCQVVVHTLVMLYNYVIWSSSSTHSSYVNICYTVK